MGTKNKPGDFDCYANAEDDEPLFVLLGRDRRAPNAVLKWASDYQIEKRDKPGGMTKSRAAEVR